MELGKLEAFYEAMSRALDDEHAQFRRTLAGALVTVARDKITIEPAPPRKAGLRK